jgi:type II secretory pathway pseudopilin PulG
MPRNSKKFFRNPKNGFSIIEVLFYISIFVILISVVTLFAATFIKSVNKNHIKKEVAQGAYAAINNIIYEIENAENVYLPTSVFGVHPGQLSLKTTQKLPEEEQITYIDFYLDNNNRLYIKREGGEAMLLTSENLRVTDLEFQYLASPSESIRISLTVDYDISDPDYQYSYSLISSGAIRK